MVDWSSHVLPPILPDYTLTVIELASQAAAYLPLQRIGDLLAVLNIKCQDLELRLLGYRRSELEVESKPNARVGSVRYEGVSRLSRIEVDGEGKLTAAITKVTNYEDIQRNETRAEREFCGVSRKSVVYMSPWMAQLIHAGRHIAALVCKETQESDY